MISVARCLLSSFLASWKATSSCSLCCCLATWTGHIGGYVDRSSQKDPKGACSACSACCIFIPQEHHTISRIHNPTPHLLPVAQHLRKRKDKRKDKLRITRNRCAVLSFVIPPLPIHLLRSKGCDPCFDLCSFLSQLGLFILDTAELVQRCLLMTYLCILSSWFFMSFHFVSYQEAKQNAQRQKVFRSNTPSFHDRFHATLHQCLYRTATTPHHSRYLPWTRPHRGDVETGACWLRCAEKHQTRAVSDSTVEVLFILFMLSYMHLNSICLVDSCESSIQAFIF